MGRAKYNVEQPDEDAATARVATSTGRTIEPEFAEPPDPFAPATESLSELIESDGIEPVRRWIKRSRRWVFLVPMNTAAKRGWLNHVVINKADGEQDIAQDHMEAAIALCLSNSSGALLVEIDEKGKPTNEGRDTLLRLHPETFSEIWEHVAALNVLRKSDGDALKNSSAGDTGTAASPDSPATTEPRPSLVT